MNTSKEKGDKEMKTYRQIEFMDEEIKIVVQMLDFLTDLEANKIAIIRDCVKEIDLAELQTTISHLYEMMIDGPIDCD